jgi:ATP-binding cassette subfamily B protein
MLFCIPLGALLIATILPYLLSQVIGGLGNHNESIVTTNLWLAATVAIVGAACNLIGFQAMMRHEANVRASLSNATFAQIMQKDMRFFVDEKIGALTSRYIDFTRSHITIQDLLIIRTLGFVLSVVAGMLIVASKSIVLALIVIALLTVLIIQVKWSLNKRAPWRHERKTLNSEINGSIADSVTNNLIVKTFAGEKREITQLAVLNKRFRDIFIKDLGFFALEGSARVFIMLSVQVISMAVSAYLILHKQMDITMAVFLLYYLQQISSQIFTLGEMLNGYDQALLEAAPMSDILAKINTVNDAPNAITIQHITPSIEFAHTSYKYDDSHEEVLKDVHLSIKPGEKIGLVGHSGAGKTTITHLLLRFSDVTGGSIAIGGHDIREVTQESLRQTIAYVPQEPLLFHRTLRENIAYGKPGATNEEIELAARQANASEFINKLPLKFDTLVGERGIKLSGGQRQRVAIARALLKDAPILLLDEATSALDSESEKLIQKSLEKLMNGRTSIVIAHRLSTIAKLDRIIVLDKGTITEQGSHAELLGQHGIYAKLWSHQSGGFIEE